MGGTRAKTGHSATARCLILYINPSQFPKHRVAEILNLKVCLFAERNFLRKEKLHADVRPPGFRAHSAPLQRITSRYFASSRNWIAKASAIYAFPARSTWSALRAREFIREGLVRPG